MSLLSDLGTVVGAEFKSHRLRIETAEANIASLHNYTLPVASTTVLGGVKAGNNITIDANGVLSANISGGVTSWSNITSKPTTIAGYGITDAYTKTETDGVINTAINNLVNLAPAALDTLGEIATQLANDASAAAALTTVVGTKANSADVYNKSEVDARILQIAPVADLSGIYTKAETDTRIAVKANIVDVYSKTEMGAVADFTTAFNLAK